MSRHASRFGLIAALLAFAIAMALITDQFARHVVRVALNAAATPDAKQTYLFAFLLMSTAVLFTALPLLMIIAYRGQQGDILSAQVAASLSLCALDDGQLQNRLNEYEDRNSLSAFFLPSLVNLVLMYLVWSGALLPHGITSVMHLLGDSARTEVSLALLFATSASLLTPLTWALLGGYFYALSLIIRRWMLADLTTSVLWKINVRLVVAFILGSLLIAISGGDATARFGPWLAAVGFLIGIVPDLFLRWVSQQLRRIGGIDAQGVGLFAPSDLQSRIDGMSFWQVDRLGEEGIESVHDLALKEIPTLLIKTRFDPPLLLHWVDRALLCAQVDEDLALFKCAHLYTGTDLLAALARPNGMQSLLAALRDGAQNCAARTGAKTAAVGITEPMIANIISGLTDGPNLRHLAAWRGNVNAVGVAWPAPLATAAPAPPVVIAMPVAAAGAGR